MTKANIVALFGHSFRRPAIPSADRDLFGHVHEARGKVVFLNEADWNEESLLQVMACNPVGMVIDMRARPVFRLPRYRHRHIISYFHKHGIHYLELMSYLRANLSLKGGAVPELANFIFDRTDAGLTICLYDEATKKRGWLTTIRAMMTSGTNQIVELHPNALAKPGTTYLAVPNNFV